MTKASAEEVRSLVSHELGAAGAAVGLDIHYDIDGETNVSSPTPSVSLKLNDESLKKAEKRTGATRSPEVAAKALSPTSPASQRQKKGDDMYANAFVKNGLSSVVDKATTLSQRSGFRNNYRSALSSQSMNPLMRVKQRRLLELRRTFDKLVQQSKKSVPIAAESLPQTSLEKIVVKAVNKGETMTPLGSIDRAKKLLGRDPEGLKKAYNRWGNFLMSGSYIATPSGPMINA